MAAPASVLDRAAVNHRAHDWAYHKAFGRLAPPDFPGQQLDSDALQLLEAHKKEAADLRVKHYQEDQAVKSAYALQMREGNEQQKEEARVDTHRIQAQHLYEAHFKNIEAQRALKEAGLITSATHKPRVYVPPGNIKYGISANDLRPEKLTEWHKIYPGDALEVAFRHENGKLNSNGWMTKPTQQANARLAHPHDDLLPVIGPNMWTYLQSFYKQLQSPHRRDSQLTEQERFLFLHHGYHKVKILEKPDTFTYAWLCPIRLPGWPFVKASDMAHDWTSEAGGRGKMLYLGCMPNRTNADALICCLCAHIVRIETGLVRGRISTAEDACQSLAKVQLCQMEFNFQTRACQFKPRPAIVPTKRASLGNEQCAPPPPLQPVSPQRRIVQSSRQVQTSVARPVAPIDPALTTPRKDAIQRLRSERHLDELTAGKRNELTRKLKSAGLPDSLVQHFNKCFESFAAIRAWTRSSETGGNADADINKAPSEVLALLDSFAMTYPDREVLDSNPPDGTRQRAALRETEPEARDLSVKEFASEMIAFILNKASRRQLPRQCKICSLRSSRLNEHLYGPKQKGAQSEADREGQKQFSVAVPAALPELVNNGHNVELTRLFGKHIGFACLNRLCLSLESDNTGNRGGLITRFCGCCETHYRIGHAAKGIVGHFGQDSPYCQAWLLLNYAENGRYKNDFRATIEACKLPAKIATVRLPNGERCAVCGFTGDIVKHEDHGDGQTLQVPSDLVRWYSKPIRLYCIRYMIDQLKLVTKKPNTTRKREILTCPNETCDHMENPDSVKEYDLRAGEFFRGPMYSLAYDHFKTRPACLRSLLHKHHEKTESQVQRRLASIVPRPSSGSRARTPQENAGTGSPMSNADLYE